MTRWMTFDTFDEAAKQALAWWLDMIASSEHDATDAGTKIIAAFVEPGGLIRASGVDSGAAQLFGSAARAGGSIHLEGDSISEGLDVSIGSLTTGAFSHTRVAIVGNIAATLSAANTDTYFGFGADTLVD